MLIDNKIKFKFKKNQFKNTKRHFNKKFKKKTVPFILKKYLQFLQTTFSLAAFFAKFSAEYFSTKTVW